MAGVMARNKEAVKLATELTESVMAYLHMPAAKTPRRDEKPASCGRVGFSAYRNSRLASYSGTEDGN